MSYYVGSISTIDHNFNFTANTYNGPHLNLESAEKALKDLKKQKPSTTVIIIETDSSGTNGKIIYLEYDDYCLTKHKMEKT